MPFDKETYLSRVRERHRSVLIRPLDYLDIPHEEDDLATFNQGVTTHQAQIDEMMQNATFMQKLTQVLGAAGGAYLVYSNGIGESSSGFTLNPITLAQNVVGRIFQGALSAPKSMLAIAMAGTTFELLYNQLEATGQAAAYRAELEAKLSADSAFSNIIKETFMQMAESMLKAYCLREIELKAEEERREQINKNYLSTLVVLINQTIDKIYFDHQKEIQADRDSWKFWRWMTSWFKTSNARETTTLTIQKGLLSFIGGFHQRLADEKTWIGNNPKRFAIYSGIGGIALGIVSTVFITSLAVLAWPVVVAAAVGGIIFGIGSLIYAKTYPFKRSEKERKQQHSFRQAVENGEEELERRKITVKEINPEAINLLEQYQTATADGYFSQNHVGVGAPHSWVRSFAKHYHHSSIVENDLAQTISTLSDRAEAQVDFLAREIRASQVGQQGISQGLQNFIIETEKYLLSTDGVQAERRYELIEKVKEGVLEAVARAGNISTIPPQLKELFIKLHGSADQLELAKSFCPIYQGNRNCFDPILEKANQLKSFMQHHGVVAPILTGAEDYWQALGIVAPQQEPIVDENIDALLNNTKYFFRLISDGMEFPQADEDKHSEAYYVYRILVMRQLAKLVFDNKVNPASVEKIKRFIKDTLHAMPEGEQHATVEDILLDIYYHDTFKPTESQIEESDSSENYSTAKLVNVDYVAKAMRLDLAFHPTVAPHKRLDKCIKAFISANKIETQDFLIFGDSSQEALTHLNFDSSTTALADIKAFQKNSVQLLRALEARPNVTDNWNMASIDMSKAYKEVVTHQALFTIKSILQTITRCEYPSDEEKIKILKKAFKSMYVFLSNSENCYQLGKHIALSGHLANLYEHLSASDRQFLLAVKETNPHVKLHSVFQGDLVRDTSYKDDELLTLRENLKLAVTGEIELDDETVLIRYKRGRDDAPTARDESSLPEVKPFYHAIYDYFAAFCLPSAESQGLDEKLVEFITETEKTYWLGGRSEIAKGSVLSWQAEIENQKRIDPKRVAKMMPRYLELREASGRQTMKLADAIAHVSAHQGSSFLTQYIADTTYYLNQPSSKVARERFELVEKIKEQLLEAITLSGCSVDDLPPEIRGFYVDILQGDEHNITHTLSLKDVSYVREKTAELDGALSIFSDSHPNVLLGDGIYKAIINGSATEMELCAPQAQLISYDELCAAFKQTRVFLRELTNPLVWGESGEGVYTEAYHLYRALIVRQLATLYFEDKQESRIKTAIYDFVLNTLHASPEGLLSQAYYQAENPPLHPADVIAAIRLDIACHTHVNPSQLLGEMIQGYIDSSQRHHGFVCRLFGDTNKDALSAIDFSQPNIQVVVRSFIDNTVTFIELLQSNDESLEWYHSSIDLSAAYIQMVTKQIIALMRDALDSLAKLDPSTPAKDVERCRIVYKMLYKFYVEHGHQLEPNHPTHLALDAASRILSSDLLSNAEYIRVAKMQLSNIDLEEIFQKDYVLSERASLFEDLKTDTKKVVVQTDLTGSMILVDEERVPTGYADLVSRYGVSFTREKSSESTTGDDRVPQTQSPSH